MAVMKDDIDNGRVALVAVVGALVLVAIIFLLQAIHYRLEDNMRVTKATRGTEWRGYMSEQQTKLNEYAWVDQSKGVVRIPVERAISLVVAEHQQQRKASPASAAATEESAPSEAAAPSGDATPTDTVQPQPRQGDGAAQAPANNGRNSSVAKGKSDRAGRTVQAGGAQPTQAP